MIFVVFLLIILFSLLLIKSADILVIALKRLSRQTKTGLFALSAIILALGTSFPELFVGITSALEDKPNLTLGVVLGSNIANIALIGGVAAVVVGRIRVHGDYLKRDVWIALFAGVLPLALIIDKNLSQVDGLILISTYLAYALGFFRKRYEQIGEEQPQQQQTSFVYRFFRQFNHFESARAKELGKIFVGISLLLFSADMIVKLSNMLAIEAGIPIFVIGLIVLAAGTSLPELAFSFRSLEDHEPSMFFGNLLGSIIANSTLVIGVAAVISPVRVEAINEYLMAVATFVIVYLSFYAFIRSKHRLDRWEAVILLTLYLVFLLAEFIW